MDKASVYKRKTIGLIAKNSIIFVVLLTVAALSIWAWFLADRLALATGVYAKAISDGVEISWDNENFHKNLTATRDRDVTKANGMRKYIADSQYSSLKLITGNGINFFEPYLNRRTATVFQKNNIWQGSIIDDSNGENKFMDIDIYFRSSEPKSIYLAGDSRVAPNDINARMSEYGAFSTDYICAASRVAFIDNRNKNCSYIWAPNSDYKLYENQAGYTRYTTTAEEKIVTSTGGSYDLEGFECEPTPDTTYYFWSLNESIVFGPDYAGAQNLSSYTPRPFTYDTKNKFYTTTVSLYIPTYSNNPTIPFFINQTLNPSAGSLATYNKYVEGKKSNEEYDQWSKGQYFQVTDSSFTIDSNNCSNGFRTNEKFTGGTKITFKLAYNPDTKRLVVLNYESANGSFTRGEEASETVEIIKYYPLKNGVSCTLVNPTNSFAITSDEGYKKEIIFRDSTSMKNILPISITTAEQFTVEKSDNTYQATYRFKNNNGSYLTISSGNVGFDAKGTWFSLVYNKTYEGPILMSGDYYLAFRDGEFTTIHKTLLNNTYMNYYIVTVYTGSTYELLTRQTDDNEYKYYDSAIGSLVSLGEKSSPPLYTSKATDTDAIIIGQNKPIITLSKVNEDDEYYTAHLVMRVWTEGTDRDAKTPLAGGKYNLSFHFTTILPK